MLNVVKWCQFAASLMMLAACSTEGPPINKSDATTTDNAQPNRASVPAAASIDTVSGAVLARFTGDAAAGQRAFGQCQTCHSVAAGENRMGPSLNGIVGRRAGTLPGYNYSAANRDSGITWTAEKLFQYLEDPQRVLPGTKMAFGGIPDAQRRADLISWLAIQNRQ